MGIINLHLNYPEFFTVTKLQIVCVFSFYLIAFYYIAKVKLKYSFIFTSCLSLIFYFSNISSARPFLLDDINYFEVARSLYFLKFDIFNFFKQEFIGFDILINESRHIAYYYNNYLAIEVWGPYYSSGIVLNHFLFVLTAIFFSKILVFLDESPKWSLYFLIHPFYQSWLILNVKDFCVMFLTTFVILRMIRLLSQYENGQGLFIRKCANHILIASCIWIISYYRFYNSIFLVVLWCYATFSNLRLRNLIIALILSGIVVMAKFFHFFERFFNELSIEPSGALRFLVTPLPFNLDPSYTFLTIVAYSGLGYLVLWSIGFVCLVKQFSLSNKKYNIIFIWFILNMVLYSNYEELQGPRHRMQIMIALNLFAIAGLKKFSNVKTRKIMKALFR